MTRRKIPAAGRGPAIAGRGGPELEPTHAAGLDLGTLKPAAYWVPIEVVKRWVKNPRINDDKIPGVMASIKRFGFGAPLLARVEDGELIAGDTRIQAAERLGWTQLPVRFMDLVAEEAGMLALADNKHSGLWNQEKLAAIVAEAQAYGETFDGVGFSDEEIEKMITAATPEPGSSEPANADDPRPENEGGTEPQLGDDLSYQVVVTCDDEGHQGRLLEELEARGLPCRPLIL